MNNIFNIRRFGLVMSKDFRENWKKYSLQFLTMFGIITVIITFYSNQRINDSYEQLNRILLEFSSFLFLGFGIIFSSTMMDSMRGKTTRIAYLTMPSSSFEKFISRWLIVTIGYVIAFFIALWMADAVRVAFMSFKFPELDFRFLNLGCLVNLGTEDDYNNYIFFSKYFFLFCISLYTFLQSLFILGATFCERASFIKTFSAIAIIVILFIYLNRGVIEIIHDSFDSFGEKFDHFFKMIIENPTEKSLSLFFACILIVLTLFSWVIAFFRFRESEIINRL